ncbi:hypothetical protein GCM10011515_10900 [Tsuneonella deserti]|uniref:DUF2336 domain-containing protein n=1 Tax=Tsuneonella deserti TaxID=2035528 RepID=A0ABQ1S409_9SPHN|nr:hypothetical protein [Tsuneonella deserti]GGD92979.1 hypothetical protein GCM10011515_10900 [Tsuneonella deserti]
MENSAPFPASEAAIEAAVGEELARGDAVLRTAGPVLGHLLSTRHSSLFSDEIVSRVRGMVGDLARQLLFARATAAGEKDARAHAGHDTPDLAANLLADQRLVLHCHALALEWQLASRLEARSAIDPVLSPLLESLIASDDPTTASMAMAALAAQARFVQFQRRMELPLDELPAEHFHIAITALERECGGDDEAARLAAKSLRDGYDEGASRLGLLARLIHAMGAGALAALSVNHAGAAIFLTALAATTHQQRDLAILSTNERQIVRLALSLRAAGLKPRAIEEQFVHLHPDLNVPQELTALDTAGAHRILGASQLNPGVLR